MNKSNHVNLSKDLLEFLNGELLGDGNLSKIQNKELVTSARYNHGSKYREYLRWLNDKLVGFGVKQSGKIVERYGFAPKSKRAYWSYRYASKSYVELANLYLKWYPNGKKIVPKDIKLTPVTVRQWYIGDGHFGKGNSYHLEIATCGFTSSDVEFLVNKLKGINIDCHRTNDNRIFIGISSINVFFDYIGNCPREIKDIYGYKWPDKLAIDDITKRNESHIKMNSTYKNKEWLIKYYVDEDMSSRELSKKFDISLTSIVKWLKKHNIRRKKFCIINYGSDGTVTKICTKCGKELPATLEYFPKAENCRLNLNGYCKKCMKTQSHKRYIKRKTVYVC